MPVRKFELFNTLKNKILTCPYCPIIPNFDINLNIKIGCYFHPNSIYKYDIDHFFYYYNNLNSQICFYCGTNTNLLFDLYNAEESPYTCNNCLKHYKIDREQKEIYFNYKLLDIDNANRCIFHKKILNIFLIYVRIAFIQIGIILENISLIIHFVIFIKIII